MFSVLSPNGQIQADTGSFNEKPSTRIGRRLSLREIAKKKIHHGNGQFINPFSGKLPKSMWQVMYWKLFSENHFKKFYKQEQVRPVSVDWDPIKSYDGLAITFLKHASIMIKDRDKYLIVDPVLFNLFWFIKDYTPLAFDIKEMPKPNYVLITHGHYDHLDKPSLAALGQRQHLISPLGYNEIYDEIGINQRIHLDWFDSFEDNEREIILLPCNHWTMRNPIVGPNRSLWGSYLIKTASGPTIFISGDTAYFERFHELGREFEIDLAIFNLGAYEPRWFMQSSHINPEETVKAFKALGARRLLVVHWGTFRLGDEPVHFPPLDIKRKMEKEGISDLLIQKNHGETIFENQLS